MSRPERKFKPTNLKGDIGWLAVAGQHPEYGDVPRAWLE